MARGIEALRTAWRDRASSRWSKASGTVLVFLLVPLFLLYPLLLAAKLVLWAATHVVRLVRRPRSR